MTQTPSAVKCPDEHHPEAPRQEGGKKNGMIEEESEELFFAFALNCSLLVLWKKNGMIEEESEDLGQAWQEYSRQKQRTIPGISAIPGIAVCNMEAKMSKTKKLS